MGAVVMADIMVVSALKEED